jgi:membrane protease YdiL (CAAX protease family)
VHIAFAVSFFIFVGLCETLRHGIFGLNPSEITGYIYTALAICALLILRGDVVFTMRQPRHALYENPRLNWTWSRSVLGMFLGPMLWIIPVVYGLSLSQINILPFSAELLIETLVIQVLLIALAEEYFFREAAIKAFRTDIPAIYLISVLAFFIFYVPQGLPTALIAAGAGMFYVTLRLIGTNILVVALVHGATNVMFAQVFSLGLTFGDEWVYAAYFLIASTVLSAAVFHLFAQKRSVYIYA